MHTSALVSRRRQMRGFVVAWLGITLLMGALTFIGIYYATSLVNAEGNDADASSVAVQPNGGELANAAAFDPNSISVTTVPVAAAKEAPAVAVVDAAASSNNDAPPADVVAAAPASDPANPLAQDATPVPSPTPVPISDTAFQMGVQVQANADPEVYRIWMGEVRDKLKLGWIKQQVRWEDIEPQPGQYEWGALDTTFALAQEHNVKVMVSVVTAPEWAREPGNQRLDEVGPPNDPQDFANFLITLLQRYRGQIHAVEVWNEMNIDREWASIYGLSAQNYVTLLQTAYQSIKMVDPGIIVISGALSPTGWDDGIAAYDDFRYMDMLIQAGMLDYTDCVGAHHNGYNIGPSVPWNNVPNDPTAQFRGPFDNPHHSWSFFSTLSGYHERIAAAGSDKKLCITEFGWPVTEDLSGYPLGFEFANDNTLAEQAQFFGEAIDQMEEWGWVWIAWVWNLNYGAQAGWDATNDNVPYSLLRPNWSPAPAYEVIGSYDFRSR